MLQVAFQGGGDGDRVGDMAVFHGFLPLVTSTGRGRRQRPGQQRAAARPAREVCAVRHSSWPLWLLRSGFTSYSFCVRRAKQHGLAMCATPLTLPSMQH